MGIRLLFLTSLVAVVCMTRGKKLKCLVILF